MSGMKEVFLAAKYGPLYGDAELLRQYREAGVAGEVPASLAPQFVPESDVHPEPATFVADDEAA